MKYHTFLPKFHDLIRQRSKQTNQPPPGGCGGLAVMNTNSPAYRTGYAITYHIGRCFRPLLSVPIIGTPLYLVIGLIVVLALLPVGLAIGVWFWITGDGRSAADPDKETPPKGWPVEVKPSEPEGFRLDRCDWCGEEIPYGETVFMESASGRILHVRCRDKELDHYRRDRA